MDRKAENLQLLEYLFRAVSTPHGLTLRTNSAHRLRQRLYPIQKKHPELAGLSFSPSPIEPETELWILNNDQKKAD